MWDGPVGHRGRERGGRAQGGVLGGVNWGEALKEQGATGE